MLRWIEIFLAVAAPVINFALVGVGVWLSFRASAAFAAADVQAAIYLQISAIGCWVLARV